MTTVYLYLQMMMMMMWSPLLSLLLVLSPSISLWMPTTTGMPATHSPSMRRQLSTGSNPVQVLQLVECGSSCMDASLSLLWSTMHHPACVCSERRTRQLGEYDRMMYWSVYSHHPSTLEMWHSAFQVMVQTWSLRGWCSDTTPPLGYIS